ncbi:MAG: hypothetical protein K6E53_15290 [Lachnospiraceae bacterium]|nr:hypothetical protein [Lachnospiraceae bacterium]
MKKRINILLAVMTLACLTACQAESYSTSETNVHISTTKDGETTEKDLSAEVSLGVSSGETDTATADDVETEGGKYDSEAYDLNYFVNTDGNLILYVPETDKNWWRMIAIDGAAETMDFVADEVAEDGFYYVEIAPTIQNGEGQAIVGHYTSDSSEEAIDFAVVDVSIEDGQVVAVTNSGFIADLSDL